MRVIHWRPRHVTGDEIFETDTNFIRRCSDHEIAADRDVAIRADTSEQNLTQDEVTLNDIPIAPFSDP